MKFSIVSSEQNASITAYVGGELHTVTSDHELYREIVDAAINNQEKAFLDLVCPLPQIEEKFKYLSDRVSVKNNRIYFDLEEVDNSLSRQLLNFLQEDLPFEPLLRFYEKLQSNPKKDSKKQLYKWVEANKIQITNDGSLLLYKGVGKYGDAFLSISSGPDVYVNGVEQPDERISQSIGDIVEMPRSKVAFDPNETCSTGLHAAGFEFAENFSNGAVLTIKVSPADVVSVPKDSFQKIRVCRYEVIGFVDKEVPGFLVEEDFGADCLGCDECQGD
jgi:hypothetical protein